MSTATSNVLTPDQARAQGFSELTFPYLDGEEHLAQSVIDDLERGGIQWRWVAVENGREIWRAR